jgi:hypothetical protein
LTPGSGIRDRRKSASGSGIRDEQTGSYFFELRNHFFAFLGVKILKFFDEDPGSGMETVRIQDLGWKKVGSGIRDKHPGSATLSTLKHNFFTFLWIILVLPDPIRIQPTKINADLCESRSTTLITTQIVKILQTKHPQ